MNDTPNNKYIATWEALQNYTDEKIREILYLQRTRVPITRILGCYLIRDRQKMIDTIVYNEMLVDYQSECWKIKNRFHHERFLFMLMRWKR